MGSWHRPTLGLLNDAECSRERHKRVSSADGKHQGRERLELLDFASYLGSLTPNLQHNQPTVSLHIA